MNNQADGIVGQDGDSAQAKAALQTSRILFAAFLAGLITFTAVALFLAPIGGQPPAGGTGGAGAGTGSGGTASGASTMPLISMIAAGYAVISVGPSFLFRRRFKGGQPEQVTTGILLQAAMLEGAALFGTVAYLLEASPIALIASGLGIVLLIWTFPGRADFGLAGDDSSRGGGPMVEEKRFGSDV